MISPRFDLHPRQERPSLDVRHWEWALGSIIGWLVRRRLRDRYNARMQRAGSLMASVQNCESREALEAVLGPPSYAMDGRLYANVAADGSSIAHPDSVEVYEKNGCSIELWFKNEEMTSIIGMTFPTKWEIATGVHDDAHRHATIVEAD